MFHFFIFLNLINGTEHPVLDNQAPSCWTKVIGVCRSSVSWIGTCIKNEHQLAYMRQLSAVTNLGRTTIQRVGLISHSVSACAASVVLSNDNAPLLLKTVCGC